jgi:hypothetical protein
MPLAPTTADDLFYARRGVGAAPLICLHGAGGTHTHWGYQLRATREKTFAGAAGCPSPKGYPASPPHPHQTYV